MNHAALVGDGRINTEAAEHILGSGRKHPLTLESLRTLAQGGTIPATGITVLTGSAAGKGLTLPTEAQFPELREGDVVTIENQGSAAVSVRARRKNGNGNTETWSVGAGQMADFDWRNGQWRKVYY